MTKGGKNFRRVFVIVSAIFILTLMIIYSYRLVHFYLLENGTSEEIIKKRYFTDTLVKTINVSNLDGGLYIIEDEYIYKFSVQKNYVWYSGQLWRILKINEDKTIDLIIDESLTILNASYEDTSYIENYLNEFYQKLDTELLTEISYCDDLLDDINNISCNVKKNANITLLDLTTYQQAGGNNSFLNNDRSYWIINKNNNGNYWYINSDGTVAIGDEAKSLGIRPVVRLKKEISLIEGEGTKENPYIVKEKKGNNLQIGEYVKFNNELWRIISFDDERIVISSEDCLKENGKCLSKTFGNSNVFEKSSLYKYLNETYYQSIIDEDMIVKSSFGIGDYVNYDYHNTDIKKIDAYVGISKVSDYYIGNKTNSYLLTTNDLEAVFTINENGSYYLDFPTKEKNIYPVLALDANININSGTGTKNNPYVLSR